MSVTNGGTVGSFVAVSSSVYTFTVTPGSQGSVSISISAAKATDAAGHDNTASNTLTKTYDSVAPTVTIAITNGVTSPTLTTPISYSATFSESVSDFTISDITATNSTIGNFRKVSGTVYTFDVSPISHPVNNVDVNVSISANTAHDTAGNGNTASDSGTPVYVRFDNHSPSVSLTTNVGDYASSSPNHLFPAWYQSPQP